MFKPILTALSLALTLTATSASANEFEMPVTADFYESDIRFTGEFGVVYRFRWYVVPSGDRLAICGIGHFRDGGFMSTVRDMARDATFFVNDQPYPVDLSFFTRVRHQAELQTGTATCRVTPAPVAGARSVGIEYGRGTYRN
ncbi:MAG: hypothetical protein AAGA70_06875 [Pseudomonadota bacterium]